MVSIKSVTLFSALAALVAAAPAPAAAPEAKAIAAAPPTADELLAPYTGVEKRDANAAPAQLLDLGFLSTLLGAIVSFLNDALTSLLTLNLNGTLAAVGDLLTNITTVLVKLVDSLTGVVVGTGLAGALNKLLLTTGLKTLLQALLTIVNQLVKSLSGKTLDSSLINIITSLRGTLNNLSTVLGSAGLGDGVSNLLNSIISLLDTLL
ncbi:uncharacterized protein SAPINGB_P004643 [Magnusiomyces paraingens]|uniref:Uncharacterized protein n=1 Tax=Magnusiomyces paraingens TaxID=2606893 RepID=A0A5E8C0R3_9ASCO|nr:uncharacterized protein SAPINGB_P004643 [Saprochaete ingens]VVT55540.1 unnamed protein product [Saprochaete ingens]